jgi:hypothetical protein
MSTTSKVAANLRRWSVAVDKPSGCGRVSIFYRYVA